MIKKMVNVFHEINRIEHPHNSAQADNNVSSTAMADFDTLAPRLPCSQSLTQFSNAMYNQNQIQYQPAPLNCEPNNTIYLATDMNIYGNNRLKFDSPISEGGFGDTASSSCSEYSFIDSPINKTRNDVQTQRTLKRDLIKETIRCKLQERKRTRNDSFAFSESSDTSEGTRSANNNLNDEKQNDFMKIRKTNVACTKVVTAEEKERQIRRREKNKIAATKCRLRKREKLQKLTVEQQTETNNNTNFKSEIENLRKLKLELQNIINSHECVPVPAITIQQFEATQPATIHQFQPSQKMENYLPISQQYNDYSQFLYNAGDIQQDSSVTISNPHPIMTQTYDLESGTNHNNINSVMNPYQHEPTSFTNIDYMEANVNDLFGPNSLYEFDTSNDFTNSITFNF